MSLVMTIRDFPKDLTLTEIKAMVEHASGCIKAWNVEWQYTYRDPMGTRTLCFYESPDAESVRIGIRQAGWTEQVAVKPVSNIKAREDLTATVIVERHFTEPANLEELQGIEDQHAWCLTQYNVKFIETYVSSDKKTMICLYHAPDAESVRNAQRNANMPFDKVWACKRLDVDILKEVN